MERTGALQSTPGARNDAYLAGEALALRGDYKGASIVLEDALRDLLAAHEQERDDTRIARASHSLAYVLFCLGEIHEATEKYREALHAANRARDPALVHDITINLALALSREGRDGEAGGYLENLQAWESARDAPAGAQGHTMMMLAQLCDRRLGERDRAKQLYARAIDNFGEPENQRLCVQALAALGELLQRCGEEEAAFDHYLRCLRVCTDAGLSEPAAVSAALRLQNLAQKLGRLAPAAEDFITSYATDPNAGIEGLTAIADRMHGSGDVTGATAVYQRAMFLAAERSDAQGFLTAGLALSALAEQQNQLEMARDVLVAVRARFEGEGQPRLRMPEVLRRLARVSAKLQDVAAMDRALSELETADFSNEAAQRAELMRALNDVGVELIAAKHYDRAVQIFGKGIEVAASLRDADMTLLGHMHYNSGLAEGLRERHNDALLEFKKAQSAYMLAKSPTNVADATTAEGQALVTLGLHEQAVATYKHEIELRSELANGGVTSELIDAIMRLGAVFSALDRNRDEAALYEDLFQRLPDLDEQGPSESLCVAIGSAQNNLGYCYFKLGRFDEALRLLRQSLRSLALSPQETLAEAFVQESLGELLAAQNDLPGTKAAYEKAVELRRRLAPGDPRLPRTLRDLAAVCEGLGELQEADVAAASCYEFLRGAPDSDPFETAKVAEMAAHIADRLGETEKRDRLLLEATSMRASAEDVQPSTSSEAGKATAGTPSVTSPSLGFLSGEEITHVVLESHLSRGTREILGVMLLFETMKQHTWLVATPSKLFCLLDDEKHRASGRLIQWEQPWRSIRSVEVKPYKPKTGLVTIGQRQNWLYSVRLHPDPDRLRDGILGLQSERLAQARARGPS